MNGPGRLRVALTMRVAAAPGHHELRDAISHDWLAVLAGWQATPFPVPNVIEDAAGYLDGLNVDLLVFTGGDDLGATPARDATERRLFEHALASSLPVLGVCRGMQLINTCFGGRLTPVDGHAGRAHGVRVSAPWRDIYGADMEVNSFHTFAVTADGLGGDLVATAFDDAGHVEGLCHRSLPVAAVMWHPERGAARDGDRTLMTRLVREGAFWA